MIEVVDTTIKHAKEISLNLREEDRQEAIALGQDPIKGVFYIYRSAQRKKTVLVDGQVAALAGVGGTILGNAQPFLVTSTVVEKVSPFTFARVYKQELEDWKKYFPVLENYVDSRYKGAIRMLKIAGFKITGPFPMRPNGALFYKFRLEQQVAA